jgi:NAD(P)-dependent dehydrogenase (short-subunit alcohol dehydrogenase family)
MTGTATRQVPELDLSGRVAVVTGAARGLGRAEAFALSSRGARVLAADVLDPADTVTAIQDTGAQAMAVVADLSAPDSAERVFEAALQEYGDVDIVVNNAGVIRDRMSFNLSDVDWELVLGVNLSATFYLARAAARHWRAQQPRLGRKAIVNTSSESGLYGNVGQANYVAAKAGVAGLTLALAGELARYGIRVNAIAPRARTPMSVAAFGHLPTADSFDPFGPEHVAAVVAWLVSEASADITGQVLVTHGGGVQLMQPWSIVSSVSRSGPWSDSELLMLRDQLFASGSPQRLVKPVADLFTLSSRGDGDVHRQR